MDQPLAVGEIDADDVVPIERSEKLVAALEAAGIGAMSNWFDRYQKDK